MKKYVENAEWLKFHMQVDSRFYLRARGNFQKHSDIIDGSGEREWGNTFFYESSY